MTQNRDLAREPCPDRIVEDLGGAFGMGTIGGFLWHFGKGWRHSPSGEKCLGALYSAKVRAPVIGRSFAVWGGTFSMFDCSFQYLRNKDDHWNAIASGASTGGLLALRGGWRSASRQAVVGGVLLAIIEGVMLVFSRRAASTPRDQYYQAVEMEKKMQAHQGTLENPSPERSPWSPASFLQFPSFLSSSPSSQSNLSIPDLSSTQSPSTLDFGTHPATSVEFPPDPSAGSSSFGSSFSSFSSEYAPETVKTSARRSWKFL